MAEHTANEKIFCQMFLAYTDWCNVHSDLTKQYGYDQIPQDGILVEPQKTISA